MAKMTPLLLRLEPELIARIDAVRGDVPRALFIRKRLGALFDGATAKNALFDASPSELGMALAPPPHTLGRQEAKNPARLTMDDVRPKADPGSRLKKPKGGK